MIKFNKDYRIGMRAAKTAFAVFVCALFSMFLHHEDILCASMAALICMKTTYQETKNAGINRFIGTIIGAVVGYGALEMIACFPHGDWLRVIVLPLCILIVVYFCNLIYRKQAVEIGCVVIIVLLSRLGQDKFDNTLIFVVERVIDTFFGIIVAGLMNKFRFEFLRNWRKNT